MTHHKDGTPDTDDAFETDAALETDGTREAGIDAIGHSNDIGAEDDPDQNSPLPDWGPTDGTHGTDAE